jgi:uncharacterized protein
MDIVYSNNLCAAFVTEITKSFQKHHPNHYLGRTAIQKLVYFCQATGVPVPCSFEIYNYGPYSDELKFTVDSLLADELLEDRSNDPSKYSNYRVANSDIEFGEPIMSQVTTHRDQIDRVVRTLGEYKPQQLELIATLHFVAAKCTSIEKVKPTREKIVQHFKRVKGDKFSDADINAWLNALVQSRLVQLQQYPS